MRKHIKERLIDILKTVAEACAYLETLKEENDTILGDCLTSLESIETAIGNDEYLEKELKNAKLYLRNKDWDNLFMSVDEIYSVIENIELSYEILFLPYKAEMWDSLESVYIKACEDKSCHVTVMPIPYCNYINDGEKISVEKISYEIERFPSFVNTTHINDYSLENMKPDVIFIHNPYDDNNTVTIVDPRFFSSELIKYTEKLVYIPYFSVFFAKQDMNKEEMLSFMSYWALPGTLNSWRTIAGSEEIAEMCRKYHFPKEKIVGLGTPKVDAVLNNISEIPKEWQNTIDKISKKVIMANPTLNYMLTNTEKKLKTLERVCEEIINSNFILLFRPHPLLLSTLRAMRPKHIETYENMLRKFEQNENVIIDLLPTYLPAFRVSNGYIGTGGSLDSLFMLTKKPIYQLAVKKDKYGIEQETADIVDKDDNNRLFNIRVIKMMPYDGEKVLAVTLCGLYTLDLNKNRIEAVGESAVEYTQNIFYQFDTCKHNENYYFIPQRANKPIVIWNSKYDTTETIEFPKELAAYRDIHIDNKLDNALSATLLHENKIWLTIFNMPIILYFDIETKVFKIINDLPKEINWEYEEYISNYAKANYVGDEIWFAPLFAPKILAIDFKTLKTRTIDIGFEKSAGFVDITYDGKNVWLSPVLSNEVICYNPTTKERNNIAISKKYDDKDYRYFSKVCFDGQNIWFAPIKSPYIIYIDKDTKNFTEIKKYPKEFEFSQIPANEKNPKRYHKIRLIVEINDKIWFIPFHANGLLYIDKSDKTKTLKCVLNEDIEKNFAHSIGLPEEYLERKYKTILSAYNYTNSNLKEYIKLIAADLNITYFEKMEYVLKYHEEESSGSRIWNYIKKEI